MRTKYIDINPNYFDSDINYFPVAVELTSDDGFMDGLDSDDWKRLRATVEGVSCFVEVAIWDTSNDRAVLWIRILTVSSTSYTTIKLELTGNETNYERAITSPEVIDDFTGTNGTQIAIGNVWFDAFTSFPVTGPTFSAQIYNNKGRLTLTGVSASAGDDMIVDSKFKIGGDFDFQISYTDLVTQSHTNAGFTFRIKFEDDSHVLIKPEYYSGDRFFCRYRDASSTDYNETYSRTYQYGKLRFVRISDTCYVYTDDGNTGSWTLQRTISSVATSLARVRMALYDYDSGAQISVDVDDLQINYCGRLTQFVGQIGEAAGQVVWGAKCRGMYHFAQDPTGGTDCILDSSFFENHCTPSGSMTAGDLIDISGILGKALNFDGTDDYLESKSNPVLAGDIDRTVICAIRTTYSAGIQRVFSLGDETVSYEGFSGYFESGNLYQIAISSGNKIWTETYSDGDWHIVTFQQNGTKTSNLSSLFDGSPATVSSTNDQTINTESATLKIGTTSEMLGGFWNGDIGFLLLVDGYKDDDWCESFTSVLNGEVFSLRPDCDKVIYFIIDNTKIDSDLTDFPIGINITSSSFLDGLGVNDWKYLKASVSGVECYIEVAVWEPENNNVVLWVKVPTVSSLTDTLVKIEIVDYDNHEREVTSQETIDDFTGTNGNDPDSDLWRKTNYIGSDYLTIQSNKLNFNPSVDPTINHSSYINSRFIASGDFNVQIDFDVTDEDYPSSGLSHLPAFTARDVTDGSNIGYISVINQSSSPYYAYRSYNSSSVEQKISRSQYTSGKLRFTRISGEVKVYYWSGSQWEWDGDTNGLVMTSSNTNDVYFRIYFEQETGTTCTTDVDNFIINSCDNLSMHVGEIGDFIATSVWDNDFIGVFHLCQDPTGGSGCILDSTLNANHGTPVGTMTSGDLVDEGFGYSLDFDGVDDRIEFPYISAYGGMEELTTEVYCKFASLQAYDYLFGVASSVTNNANRHFRIGIEGTATYLANAFFDDSNVAVGYDVSTTVVSTTVFQYWAGVYDGLANSDSKKLFLDGLLDTYSAATGNDISSVSTDVILAIGSNAYGTSAGFVNAKISEVRFSKIDRSAAWIKATNAVLEDTLLSEYTPPVASDNAFERMKVLLDGSLKPVKSVNICMNGVWKPAKNARIVLGESFKSIN